MYSHDVASSLRISLVSLRSHPSWSLLTARLIVYVFLKRRHQFWPLVPYLSTHDTTWGACKKSARVGKYLEKTIEKESLVTRYNIFQLERGAIEGIFCV